MDEKSRPSILQNSDCAAQLERQGYSVLPFLNERETTSLTHFFNSHHTALPEGMYATAHSVDLGLRKIMNDEIKSVCARAINATFQHATPLGATFMVKSKGEHGSLPPHQDWSIVDESQYNSYNIWLPLVDVSEINGTLLILPGSHKLIKNVRGLNIPSSFQKVQEELQQYLIPMKMKAGEALVYDHRLLHASGINQTNTPRLAVVYGIVPAGASMRYYYGTEANIQEYECTPDFYFNEEITKGPGGLKLIKNIQTNLSEVTVNELEEHYKKPLTLFQKLMAPFK